MKAGQVRALTARAQRECPGLAGELHLRASAWYEENGLISEAIDHAFSASDNERAARLRAAEQLAETTAKQDHRFLLGYAAAVRSWHARLRGTRRGQSSTPGAL